MRAFRLILILLLLLAGALPALAATTPVALFTVNDTRSRAPMTVMFTDSSTNYPAGWAWFFGDENYSRPWVRQTAGAPWRGRWHCSAVTLPDGSIVMTGGSDGANMNDTWRSADKGVTWVQQSASAAWVARHAHSTVALPDGSIVLTGGGSDTGYQNDTWRSADKGATWTLVNESSGWSERGYHTTVVLPDGSIVLMGGESPGYYNLQNDVWRSVDRGETWVLQTADAAWPERYGLTSLALPDGTLVMMAGASAIIGPRNDTWRSTDKGVTWTSLPNAPWENRQYTDGVVMPDGTMILTGGKPGGYLNDTWASTDGGSTWRIVNMSSGWPVRSSHKTVALPDGSIVLLGGENWPVAMNDVWRIQPAGSSAKSPVHTYTAPGTYTVALQAFNSAGYNSSRRAGLITVMPENAPYPLFTSSTRYGTAPFMVTFTDRSLNSTSREWRFGDGGISTAWKPLHTYTKPGTYTVNLTARNDTDPENLWDSLIRTKYIIITHPKVSEPGIFRRSTGFWYMDYNMDNTPDASVRFGAAGDIPVSGDWDGDKTTEIGYFRPATGMFYLDYNNNGVADRQLKLGRSGDTPVAGDWDKDGLTEPGIFRNTTGTWYLNTNGIANISAVLGMRGDIPVTGDWDSDNATEIGIYRPSNRTWYLDYNNNGVPDKIVKFGRIGDTPLTGNWDLDRMTEIGVRNTSGFWFLDTDNNGIAEIKVKFGGGTDKPVVGDWDADGRVEIGFFRPTEGNWYLDYDNNGVLNLRVKLGGSGDTPIAGHWA